MPGCRAIPPGPSRVACRHERIDPHSPAAELERELQARLLRLVCAVATLLGCIYSVYFASIGLLLATALGPICVAISAVAFGMARSTGRSAPAIDLACALLFVVLAGMTLLQDGIRSPALWWLAVPPVIALLAARWWLGALLCASFVADVSALRVHGPGSWASVSLLADDPGAQLTLAMTLSALSLGLFVALGSHWRRRSCPTAASRSALQHAPPADLAGDRPQPVALRGGLIVLVADDDGANRSAVTAMLERLAVRSVVAEDGAQALALVAAQCFDAVLLQVALPVLDGLEVTRRWRAAETGARLRRLPIIALAGQAERVDVQACAAAGIDDILTGPFGVDDLRLLLAELVARDEHRAPGRG